MSDATRLDTSTVINSTPTEVSPENDSNPTEELSGNDATPMDTVTGSDTTSLESSQVKDSTTSTADSIVIDTIQQPSPHKPSVPARPTRKLKPKPSSAGTLDKYVSRTESPSAKRKLSDDSLSPSSAQNRKSNRTDGADTVS